MTVRNVVLVALVVVAFAGAGLLAAGFLDGDAPPTDGADAGGSDSPADDGSVEGPDESSQSGVESETDGDAADGDATDGTSDGGTESGTDASETESEDSETVDVPVEIYAVDRGPIDDGELRLYNTTSGERVLTYNFSDGHQTVLHNVTRKTTYDLVVNVSFYPDETITFNPRISDEINETIGYEFRGADTYEMDWEVDYLPTNVDIDDEGAEEKTITYRGYSALDEEGNYYSEWSAVGFNDPIQYLYLARNNQTYLNGGTRDTGWEQIDSYWGDPSTSRETVTREGLSDARNRTFLETKELVTNDELHVYYIPAGVADSPLTVHVDPDTGYVMKTDVRIEEVEDPDTIRDEAEIYSHDENFTAIPDDFKNELDDSND